MKKITSFILILIAFQGFSQNDAKAKSLLDEVSAKMKSYDNLFIDFKYVLENTAEHIQQETRGDVTLKKDKYLLNMMGVVRLFDGKSTYTIVPEDEEITISSQLDEDKNSITPAELLTFYQNGYAFQWDKEQNLKGRKIQYVKLLPTDPKSEIKHILLGIDAQTKNIYNLIEIGKNGTQTTLTISSLKVNQPISDKLFTFDASKYPDYYINKLN
ncbi:MAG: outer membrane lipoprotein carrier protein LolA [Bacteroidetes bacterium]|nr:outer membrane lipoprotein carrier protein LolA [Bacteroidota bacterium]